MITNLVKNVKYLLVASLAMFGSNSFAQSISFEQNCATHLRKPSVKIVVENSKLVYELNKSSAEISDKKHSENKSMFKHTLGLTESQASFASDYGLSKYTQGALECFTPVFSITLKVSPQKIYIAKEISRDSCLFKEVLDHELRHAKANQEAIEQLADELDSWVRGYAPEKIYYGNSAAWLKSLRDDINSKIMPYIQKKYEALSADNNSSIDTDAEYTRLSLTCNAEAQSLGLK